MVVLQAAARHFSRTGAVHFSHLKVCLSAAPRHGRSHNHKQEQAVETNRFVVSIARKIVPRGVQPGVQPSGPTETIIIDSSELRTMVIDAVQARALTRQQLFEYESTPASGRTRRLRKS